jgi:hypothetical protein
MRRDIVNRSPNSISSTKHLLLHGEDEKNHKIIWKFAFYFIKQDYMKTVEGADIQLKRS